MGVKIHVLKIMPIYFQDVIEGRKKFEVRRNDRDFKVGDIVILKEFEYGKYTGRTHTTRITYILDDAEYCKDGYVIFGIGELYGRYKCEEKESGECPFYAPSCGL